MCVCMQATEWMCVLGVSSRLVVIPQRCCCQQTSLLCSALAGRWCRLLQSTHPPTHTSISNTHTITLIHAKHIMQKRTYLTLTGNLLHAHAHRVWGIISHLINSSSCCLRNSKHLQSFMSAPRNSHTVLKQMSAFNNPQLKHSKDWGSVFLQGHCSFVCVQ